MVYHVILWKLNDELSEDEKKKVKADIKENLEGLKFKIPGLKSINVITDGMSSSNADVMLDSVFEDKAALEGYQKNSDHVKVADTFVRPFAQLRICMDYEK